MPILKDFRQTKEISLPGYPDSKMIIYSGLLLKDAEGIDSSNETKYLLSVLPKLIKEWNFANEKGETLPINAENLKMLDLKSVEFLVGEVRKMVEEQKKN